MIINFLQKLKAEGWTQKAIAEKVGIEQNQICRFLQGKTCTLETAVKIADAFKVPLDEVIGRKPPRKGMDNHYETSRVSR